MGRNKKSDALKLTLTRNVRFTVDEWAEIEFTCSALGITRSELLHKAALEQCKRERRLIKDMKLDDTSQIRLMALASYSHTTVEVILKRLINYDCEQIIEHGSAGVLGKFRGEFSKAFNDLKEKFMIK